MNSHAVKAFGDERIAAGESCLVIDLGDCTGIDSTFMGTLAGMATRIAARQGSVLQIAGSSDRNRRSLEDLGLDFLLEIDPPAAVWRGMEKAIRSKLTPPHAARPIGQVQRTRHVLDAHLTLAGINDKNASEFKEVVTVLGNELAAKEKLVPLDEPQ
jgi:anti-anti-sigma regulatory factor